LWPGIYADFVSIEICAGVQLSRGVPSTVYTVGRRGRGKCKCWPKAFTLYYANEI